MPIRKLLAVASCAFICALATGAGEGVALAGQSGAAHMRGSMAADRANADSATSRVYGVDLRGSDVHQLMDGDSSMAVLFFVATDCPVSNRYFPEIARLQDEFARKNVRLWEVYPNAGETLDGVREHEKKFGGTGRVLLDPQQRTVRLTGAKITPEAAVLVAKHGVLTTVYLGRIDDRYVRIGVERPQATKRELENAIAAVLEHHAVKGPAGPAVGCGIMGSR